MEPINKGEFINFEDGEGYYAIDTIIHNDQKYIYFAKVEGGPSIFLGKEIIQDGELEIVVVDNEEETKEVMSLIVKKNNWD